MRVRSEDLLWTEVGGEVVLLDQRRELYLGVNRSGAVLWPALVEGTEPSELAERLADHYGIDADRARADVDALLAGLQREGLLE